MAAGDLIVTDTRVGVGTTENLSTLTVRPTDSSHQLSGTATTDATATLTGAGTLFLTELAVGDLIEVGPEAFKKVIAIASDTSLTADSAFVDSESGQCVTRLPPPLTGTVTTNGSTALVGAGTLFLSELGVGNRILVQGESNSRTIVAIASDTSLTVDSVFYTTASGLSAAAVPSAVRVDDSGGDPQILVTDDGRVGVGTLTPNGQMEVGGTGAGDLDGCPIGLNIHMQPDADPWPLVMSTDVGGVPNGFAIWVTQMGGGTTLTFSVFEGDNVTVQDFVSLDADGFHLANAQFTAQPTSISGAYAVQAPDYHLLADAGTVITLPAATDAPGRVLNIVKTADGAPVSVAPASGDTINGSATAQIIGPTFSGLLLYTDGGNWFATSLPVASTPVTVTANYQILESDQYVLADAGSAGIVVALPAVANSTGQVITIIKTAGAGTVSVSPQPGETINGGPSEQTIGPLFSGLLLYGAGTTWTATRLPAASSPVHVTVDYTITPTDRIVYVDAAAGAVAVTLPTFNENSGRVLRIIKVDATANEVTLTPASGETINGAASKMITTPYSGIQLTALPEATTWLGIVLSAA